MKQEKPSFRKRVFDMNPIDKVLFILLILAVSSFALSYGGDAFPNQSQITSGWFINTTAFYPYPMVYNQTNETNISVNSSYPFNISFKFQLNSQEGAVENLNITSPQLMCTDYNNDETYGNYSNHTLNDWECNGTNVAAGYTTFQFEVVDMIQYSSQEELITGTYQADVAQPPNAPLAYAQDNPFAFNQSDNGTAYAQSGPDDTPYTTLLAEQELQQKQQNETVSNMTILPVQITPGKKTVPVPVKNTTPPLPLEQKNTTPVPVAAPVVQTVPIPLLNESQLPTVQAKPSGISLLWIVIGVLILVVILVVGGLIGLMFLGYRRKKLKQRMDSPKSIEQKSNPVQEVTSTELKTTTDQTKVTENAQDKPVLESVPEAKVGVQPITEGGANREAGKVDV